MRQPVWLNNERVFFRLIANLRSQHIAVKSGFRPAWVETEAIRLEDES